VWGCGGVSVWRWGRGGVKSAGMQQCRCRYCTLVTAQLHFNSPPVLQANTHPLALPPPKPLTPSFSPSPCRCQPTSISLKAGCELFLRYTTRTSELEMEDFAAAKARLIEVGPAGCMCVCV
jgi:hypothetical protein